MITVICLFESIVQGAVALFVLYVAAVCSLSNRCWTQLLDAALLKPLSRLFVPVLGNYLELRPPLKGPYEKKSAERSEGGTNFSCHPLFPAHFMEGFLSSDQGILLAAMWPYRSNSEQIMLPSDSTCPSIMWDCFYNYTCII